MNRMISTILSLMFLFSILAFAANVRLAMADDAIFIRSDGSVYPSTAPIHRDGDLYSFTGDINASGTGITIERSNMTLDGAGYTLRKTGLYDGNGVSVSGARNVTLKALTIRGFRFSIWLSNSSNSSVLGSRIEVCEDGMRIYDSENVNISGNRITASTHFGMLFWNSSRNDVLENFIEDTDVVGVLFGAYSNHNRISGNTVTSGHGITLQDSSYNAVSGNNLTANRWDGVYLLDSSFNNISRNHMAENGLGIELYDLKTRLNRIFENNITVNAVGIYLFMASNNLIFNNNFLDNSEQIEVVPGYSYANRWDGNYPTGGNYWNDYIGVDVKSGSNQDLPGSDGIGDTPKIIDMNNRDQYPLMNSLGGPKPQEYALTITTVDGGSTDPSTGTYSYTGNSKPQIRAIPDAEHLFDHWELNDANIGSANPYSVLMDKNNTLKAVFSLAPDVAVISIEPLNTEVYPGWNVNFTVTVKNEGNTSETFSVISKYVLSGVEHVIDTQTVTNLAPNTYAVLNFTWMTTDAGEQILKVEIPLVQDEKHTADNTMATLVKVRLLGDINNDNKVDIKDLAQTALAFGSYPTHLRWNPQADINQDRKVDIRDLVIIAKNFGKSLP